MYFCISALGRGRGSQQDLDQEQRASIQLADSAVAQDAPAQAGRNVARRVVLATYRNTEIHSMTKLFSKHTTIVLNEALTADLGDLFT